MANEDKAQTNNAAPDGSAEAKDRDAKISRRQHLEHHLRTSPTDLDGFMELAGIYRSEDRPMEAKRILEQAKKIFPDEENVIWEYEEAVLARSMQQFREVADLHSRLNTAETQRELQRSESDWASRRIEVCKARLKRDPKADNLRLVMAEAMYDGEMYDEAIKVVEPILANDAHSPQAYLLKGRCLLQTQKDVEAMAALRAASLRRSVTAPPRIKLAALQLLCETAERLGVSLTLKRYQEVLALTQQQIAQQQ